MHLEVDMLMTSWNVGTKPTRYPGILKTETGYRVRVRAVDPKTGTLKEKNREFEAIDVDEALRRQTRLRAEIRDDVEQTASRTRYGDYVTLLLKSKTARNELWVRLFHYALDGKNFDHLTSLRCRLCGRRQWIRDDVVGVA